MDKDHGRWLNAPLAYLIAEVRFQRPQDIDKTMPSLIEKIANDFPLEEIQSVEATVESGAKPTFEPVRDFKNFKSTMGVRVTKNGFSLHCTDYEGWTDGFEKTWLELVKMLADTLRPRVLLRSSLRHIDLLVPDGNGSPDAFLAQGLRPWNVGDDGLGEFEQGNIAMRFKQGLFTTTVLVLSRVKGQVVLPPTVSSMSLILSAVQQKALQFQARTGLPFAILDTDAAHEAAIPFDLAQVTGQFSELHRLARTAFLAATTVEAQKQWQRS